MTLSAQLRATAAAYDAIAAKYTEFARDELDALPLDRAILAAFAELIKQGTVADLGCGSGRITAHLQSLGLDVFGIDISPELITIARETYQELQFDIGSMSELDTASGSLAGIVSWYSIIHSPPAELSSYFAEFYRALEPGGHLLMAFFDAEDEPVTEFDHAVTKAYRWPIADLCKHASDAGFVEVGRMLREPHENERFRRGHLIMRARSRSPGN